MTEKDKRARHIRFSLMSLAQKHNGLEDFLGSIMAFFERRTDFFHVMQTKEERIEKSNKETQLNRNR